MLPFLEVSAGGQRWQILPALRDVLLGERGLCLAGWLQDGQARLVKQNAQRRVYEVMLPGLHFFLKHNRVTDGRARLRRWLRPDKALQEFDLAREIARRQVPTVEPLAVGIDSSGESYFLSRALSETVPLNFFLEQELPGWDEPRRGRMRRSIAVVLGQFLGRMHNAGIVHEDLHPGNLLLSVVNDRPQLFLIDLQAVRLGAKLQWPASRANLVVVNRWFVLRSTRADRLRFWHGYCTARRQAAGVTLNPHGCVCRHRCDEIEGRTQASNRALWRSFDARCLENNRRFGRVAGPGVAGHAVTDLDQVVIESLLREPDTVFEQSGVKLLKNSRSATVADLEMAVGGRTHRVIWKRFRVTSWRDPWLALLRPAGALRSWVMGHGMRLRWLPTPRPLLLLHRQRHGLKREGYLLTAKVQGSQELQEFVAGLAALTPREQRQQLAPVRDEIARLVRELHDRRLSHRDLKAPNLLVVTASGVHQASSEEPIDHWPLARGRVWFIDLVGVRDHFFPPSVARYRTWPG
jgi:tRNA A-37 threonylcarbamoyl transferase component Bud32